MGLCQTRTRREFPIRPVAPVARFLFFIAQPRYSLSARVGADQINTAPVLIIIIRFNGDQIVGTASETRGYSR